MADRLEHLIAVLSAGRLSLQREVAQLGVEIQRGFDRLAEQGAGADRLVREASPPLHETSERIDKLVVAIRAMILRKSRRS